MDKLKNFIGGVLYFIFCVVLILCVGVYATISMIGFVADSIKTKIIKRLR